MSIMDQKICDILFNKGLITEGQIDTVLSRARGQNSLEKLLLEEQIVGEEELTKAVAEGFGLGYIDPSSLPQKPLISEISPELMHKYAFIPIKKENGKLLIAVHNPSDIVKIDELESLLNSKIDLMVASRSAIENIQEYLVTQGEALAKAAKAPMSAQDAMAQQIVTNTESIANLIGTVIDVGLMKIAGILMGMSDRAAGTGPSDPSDAP